MEIDEVILDTLGERKARFLKTWLWLLRTIRAEMEEPGASRSNSLYSATVTLNIILEGLIVIVNLFTVVVVLKTKRGKERIVTDEVVLYLSIAHILAVLLSSPIILLAYIRTGWSQTECVLYEIITGSFRIVSILLITYMCLDRAVLLRHAINYKVTRVCTVAKVKFVALALFFVSIFVASLPLTSVRSSVASIPQNKCESWLIAQENRTSNVVFYQTLLSLGFVNSAVVIVSNTYVILIAFRLKKTMSNLSLRQGSPIIPELREERNSIFEYSCMCFTLSVLFYFTWIPVLIMVALQAYGQNISNLAIKYAFTTHKLTDLLNPFLYAICSISYRRGYKDVLSSLHKCICQCKRNEFLPVPDISWDNHIAVIEDEDHIRRSRYHLCKSQSFYDKPVRGGFQNHGLDSIHSELSSFGEVDRFKWKHLECGKQECRIKRSRSLSCISYKEINTDESCEHQDMTVPTDSVSNNSISSISADQHYPGGGDAVCVMANNECNNVEMKLSISTLETAI